MVRVFFIGALLGVASFWFGVACATKKIPPKSAIATYEELREMPIIVDHKHDSGEPIKVMIIDTGIAQHPWLKGIVQYDESSNYKDEYGHGTHVAGIVAFGNNIPSDRDSDRLCSRVQIYSCAYYNGNSQGEENIRGTIECIQKAIDQKMDYINYSGGGVLNSNGEYEAYKKFTEQGGTVVVAAGNESMDLRLFPYYPASYKFDKTTTLYNGRQVVRKGLQNFFIAEAVDKSGKLHSKSNHHPEALKERGVDILSTLQDGQFGYMTGTSQAAPGLLHTILKQKCEQNSDLLHATK